MRPQADESIEVGERLDFLELLGADLAAGTPRTLEEYRHRFPTLSRWLESEYSALQEGAQQRPSGERPAAELDNDADLLAHLRTKGSGSARYRTGDELGRGGTSRVLTARDVELGRDVAVKVLSDKRGGQLRRFLREARITGRLEHPGILPVYDLGLDARGQPFFSMRLVRGRSLATSLAELGERPSSAASRRLLEAVLKVCDTLAFVHAQGVIHRDVKPGNVMVGEYGEVYVVDWGLARVVTDLHEPGSEDCASAIPDAAMHLTRDGDVLGTPAYMSPEQAAGDGKHAGPQSDVCGVGALIYHLVAGHPPYADGRKPARAHEIAARIRTGPPTPLQEAAPTAPRELVSIACRAMARAPADRYPTCAAMAADLRAYLGGHVVLAHHTSWLVRSLKWFARNRALGVALGVGLLLALALGYRSAQARAKERDLVLLAALRGPFELLAEFDTLWPAGPDRCSAQESWLARAAELRRSAAQFEDQLDELRLRATRVAQPEWVQETEEALHIRRLELAHRAILATQGLIARFEFEGTADQGLTLPGLRANLASLERELRILEQRRPGRIRWNFADPRVQLLHDRLESFLAEVDVVCGRGQDSYEVRLVRAALAGVGEAPATDEFAAAWHGARPAIFGSSAYHGFDLPVQADLVPLGPDPRSGLWEFVQPASGRVPRRGADGELVVGGDTGIVLVLLPGGPTRIGAQRVDPSKPLYDPQARPEEGPTLLTALEPYFLGKYEVTVGQWTRLTGTAWSDWFATARPTGDAEALPVASVSAAWATVALGAYGLRLPSSIELESATRGGTDTPWWCGSDEASLAGAGNIADRSWQRALNFPDADIDGPVPFDDGFSTLAPVGSFAPNPYGLHDVLGNVAEWCRDRTQERATQTLRHAELWRETYGLQLARGGAANRGAAAARSAARWQLQPEFRGDWLGLRAAREILP